MRVRRQAERDQGERGVDLGFERNTKRRNRKRFNNAWGCPTVHVNECVAWPSSMAFRCTPKQRCIEMTGRVLEDCVAMEPEGQSSENRLRRLEDGRYEYRPKKGMTFTLTAEALVSVGSAAAPGETALDELSRGIRP
jgi:hypothetical protein